LPACRDIDPPEFPFPDPIERTISPPEPLWEPPVDRLRVPDVPLYDNPVLREILPDDPPGAAPSAVDTMISPLVLLLEAPEDI
jgi:hypothetical protein